MDDDRKHLQEDSLSAALLGDRTLSLRPPLLSFLHCSSHHSEVSGKGAHPQNAVGPPDLNGVWPGHCDYEVKHNDYCINSFLTLYLCEAMY